MTFGHEFGDRSLVQRSSDQEDNIVDHVTVGDEVQERGQVA